MIPQMGQRKFIVNGKQRGRNELILLYMEMGIRTNPRISEERRNDLIRGFVRKKISSHIQTIKGYLQGHPACKLFRACNVQRANVSQASRYSRVGIRSKRSVIHSRMIHVC
jgi:hypothetical protein